MPYAWILSRIAKEHDPKTWLQLGLGLDGGAIAYLAICWLIILDRAHRESWLYGIRAKS